MKVVFSLQSSVRTTRKENLVIVAVVELSGNITWHLGEGSSYGGNVYDDVGSFDLKRKPDRIAAASFSDGGNVNGGRAMAAYDVLAVLAIAFRAADAASVERNAPALRLFDDEERKS